MTPGWIFWVVTPSGCSGHDRLRSIIVTKIPSPPAPLPEGQGWPQATVRADDSPRLRGPGYILRIAASCGGRYYGPPRCRYLGSALGQARSDTPHSEVPRERGRWAGADDSRRSGGCRCRYRTFRVETHRTWSFPECPNPTGYLSGPVRRNRSTSRAPETRRPGASLSLGHPHRETPLQPAPDNREGQGQPSDRGGPQDRPDNLSGCPRAAGLLAGHRAKP